MNHNHPKSLRIKRQVAKKQTAEFKKILKRMDAYLNSQTAHVVEISSAFFQILNYHIEEGDLSPYNVNLAAYLRKNNNE